MCSGPFSNLQADGFADSRDRQIWQLGCSDRVCPQLPGADLPILLSQAFLGSCGARTLLRIGSKTLPKEHAFVEHLFWKHKACAKQSKTKVIRSLVLLYPRAACSHFVGFVFIWPCRVKILLIKQSQKLLWPWRMLLKANKCCSFQIPSLISKRGQVSGPSVSCSISVFHQWGSFILKDKEAENFFVTLFWLPFLLMLFLSFSW